MEKTRIEIAARTVEVTIWRRGLRSNDSPLEGVRHEFVGSVIDTKES